MWRRIHLELRFDRPSSSVSVCRLTWHGEECAECEHEPSRVGGDESAEQSARDREEGRDGDDREVECDHTGEEAGGGHQQGHLQQQHRPAAGEEAPIAGRRAELLDAEAAQHRRVPDRRDQHQAVGERVERAIALAQTLGETHEHQRLKDAH